MMKAFAALTKRLHSYIFLCKVPDSIVKKIHLNISVQVCYRLPSLVLKLSTIYTISLVSQYLPGSNQLPTNSLNK